VATSKKATKRRPLVKGPDRNARALEVMSVTSSRQMKQNAAQRSENSVVTRAEGQRADLLAVATHDLRNPLGVVLVTATMLARELTVPNQLEQVAAIRRAALEMTHIIEDLTDGASIDAGRLEVDQEPCDVAGIVEEAVVHARASLADRAIAISAQVERSLPLLHADRLRLQQVFSRLVANASRFITKSGELRIEAVKQGDMMRFSVVDSGPPIPESQRPYAFMRRPPSGRRSSRATGLGMFVVKGIVEAHGGSVELTSHPEHGNCVSFTIPIVQEA